METAYFGGGCFWCVEAVLEILRGVEDVTSGYAGGSSAQPSYTEVSMGQSGHVEIVQVTYDPAIVTYDQLLAVFFSSHDPTTLNRQGHDVGTQYRSVIFYADEAQKKAAEAYIQKLTDDQVFADPIVTAIEPMDTFYEAEAKHQDYYRRSDSSKPGYCVAVIAPKVAKVRKEFAHLLKENDPE